MAPPEVKAGKGLRADGTPQEWLRATLHVGGAKLGPEAHQRIPGLLDNDMTIYVSVDHVVAVVECIHHVSNGDGEVVRSREAVNLHLVTGLWVTVEGNRDEVAGMLGIS